MRLTGSQHGRILYQTGFVPVKMLQKMFEHEADEHAIKLGLWLTPKIECHFNMLMDTFDEAGEPIKVWCSTWKFTA